ncbi:hypothetical protein TWF730_008913 [Orbilia blumenaviensis]|uniref:F-box protein n=1 Tax=Orbilia blumenaviensis TaxID=1796055 RepID=A0AAV9UZK4_9PEZI
MSAEVEVSGGLEPLPKHSRPPSLDLPCSWEEIPFMTPSQSETDDSSSVAETITSAPSEPSTPTTNTNQNDDDYALNDTVFTESIEFTKHHNCTIINENKSIGRISRYLVSEDVLCVSSSVLRLMFTVSAAPQRSTHQGKTQRGGNSPMGGKILRLEGHPDAIEIILGIIHFCPPSGLENITFGSLTRLASVVERYQWKDALQPWSNIWIKKFQKHALSPGYENWLYVAKVFCGDREVDRLVNRLADECGTCGINILRYNEDGTKTLPTELWPKELKYRILGLRERRLNHLNFCLTLLLAVFNYTSSLDPLDHLCSNKACLDLAYGSLLRSMSVRNIPITPGYSVGTSSEDDVVPKAAKFKWNRSAAELEKELKELTVDTLDVVIPSHRCSLRDLKAGFAECMERHDLSGFDRIPALQVLLRLGCV